MEAIRGGGRGMGTFQEVRDRAKRSDGTRTPSFGASDVPHRYRIRRVTSFLASDQELEHQRWSNVMTQDHACLRQLIKRLEQVEQTRERTMLVRLALDFHEMHSAFEAGWMQISELRPARITVEELAETIGCTSPSSKRYDALVLSWKAHLVALMQQEEIFHHRTAPVLVPLAPWSTEVLEWRVSLCSEMRSYLTAEANRGDA